MSNLLITSKKLIKIIFLLFKLLIFYAKNDLIKEKQNLRFWYILVFAVGILFYFFCNHGIITIFTLLITLLIPLNCIYNLFFKGKNFIFIKFLLFFLFGIAVAFFCYQKIDKTYFKSPAFNITIDAKIEQIKLTSDDYILFLKVIKSPYSELLGKKIRIKCKEQQLQSKKILSNGNIVRITTSLIPIKYSFFPQDTSYENYAKFFHIIATGRAKNIEIIDSKNNKNNFFEKFNTQRRRNNIQKRIFNVNHQSVGSGIVIAMLTGNNSFIPKTQLSNIRHSGCAHILAISGLHMSIVVAFIFSLFIHLFALFPNIALRYNTKKLAIIPVVTTCMFYLQIANVPISATRSFLMVLIGAMAILLNRSKASLNTFFITFFLMLVISPNYLLSPSFQMSFMAVFGLITIYNNVFFENILFSKKTIYNYIFGILLSSIIATLCTVFFEIYHFKQYAWIGIVSNIFVIPISEFLVLPIGFIGMLFNGTLIGDLCYIISGFFANIVCMIADWTASLPYSFLSTKQMTNFQLASIISGIIIFLLSYAKILKICGIILFTIGIILYINNPQFVLLYDKNLKNIVFFEDGQFYSAQKIKNEYLYSIWSQNLGSNINIMNEKNKSLKCFGERTKGNMLCEYMINGVKINIKQDKNNNKIVGVKIKNNKPIYIE